MKTTFWFIIFAITMYALAILNTQHTKHSSKAETKENYVRTDYVPSIILGDSVFYQYEGKIAALDLSDTASLIYDNSGLVLNPSKYFVPFIDTIHVKTFTAGSGFYGIKSSANEFTNNKKYHYNWKLGEPFSDNNNTLCPHFNSLSDYWNKYVIAIDPCEIKTPKPKIYASLTESVYNF